jgi:hypothetical protein
LAENPKEEYKIDPLSSVLEVLGAIKPGERVWFQIIFRAHKKEKRKGFFSEGTDWQKRVDELRKTIFEKIAAENRRTPTDAEKQIIDALQRALTKFPFDVGMRAVYIADKKLFNQGTIGGLRGLLRPFGYTVAKYDKFHYAGFNSFKMEATTDFADYPWEDFMDMRANKMKHEHLDAYKRRMMFFDPYEEKTFVLTSEALATLFHFPGSATATPGLDRIPSKRGQAPSNLPI